MAPRYFLKLAYNGSAYHGWQVQPNAISVQEVLEDALSKLLHDSISLVGCGRTDAGVHASMFYAHFETEKEFDKFLLVRKMNRFLRDDIIVFDCFRVSPDFHARFSAQYRTYYYYVSTQKDPFRLAFSYQLFRELDFDKMNEAASMLLEYSDFSSFSKSHTQTMTNNCKILQAVWEQTEETHIWVFKITADRFLRNMVRAIVGTLLEIGYCNISMEEFRQIVESKDRNVAGVSVPASALFLHHIKYEWDEGTYYG